MPRQNPVSRSLAPRHPSRSGPGGREVGQRPQGRLERALGLQQRVERKAGERAAQHARHRIRTGRRVLPADHLAEQPEELAELGADLGQLSGLLAEHRGEVEDPVRAALHRLLQVAGQEGVLDGPSSPSTSSTAAVSCVTSASRPAGRLWTSWRRRVTRSSTPGIASASRATPARAPNMPASGLLPSVPLRTPSMTPLAVRISVSICSGSWRSRAMSSPTGRPARNLRHSASSGRARRWLTGSGRTGRTCGRGSRR